MATPAPSPKKSSSSLTEASTPADKVKEEYTFDASGNGVTDNKPVGWDDESPSGTVTTTTATENASTTRPVEVNIYAEASENDDKGLTPSGPEAETKD